jgi:hypothetical protein
MEYISQKGIVSVLLELLNQEGYFELDLHLKWVKEEMSTELW